MSTFFFCSVIHRKALLYWPVNFLMHWHEGFLWYWHGNWTSVLQLICKLFSIWKMMKALFCSGLQGLFCIGSPFCHPPYTKTHTISFPFPRTRSFQALVITELQDVICMGMYIGILGFVCVLFLPAWMELVEISPLTLLGAESLSGNSHFFRKIDVL